MHPETIEKRMENIEECFLEFHAFGTSRGHQLVDHALLYITRSLIETSVLF